MNNDKPARLSEHWTTIAVTALPPGWVNVWRQSDGTEYAEPCPAMLLQECRTRTKTWTETRPDGTPNPRYVELEATSPYDTRVIYGQNEPDCGATIYPVDDPQYLRTEFRYQEQRS